MVFCCVGFPFLEEASLKTFRYKIGSKPLSSPARALLRKRSFSPPERASTRTRTLLVVSGSRKRSSTSARDDKTKPRYAGSASPPLEPTYRISPQQLLKYERKGYVCTRGLFTEDELSRFRPAVEGATSRLELKALRQRVSVLCPGVDATQLQSKEEAQQLLATRAVEEVGFLQYINLHQTDQTIDHLLRSPRVAAAAAALLGCNRVRLYQSCAFLKNPGHGPTNWHSDLNMVPLDTNQFVTLWIPFRAISQNNDTGLEFACGSHRDFALPYWHKMEGYDLATRGYKIESAGAMAMGDVTWHAGWTLHCAPSAPKRGPRRLALTASYFADGAQVLPRGKQEAGGRRMVRYPHTEDEQSYLDWLQMLRPGDVAGGYNLPLVFPTDAV
ncbi:hypothetical protein CYMTET_46369 [Cymbomonas tetramitiformis]|uniref:Phytanoyl-CoA dioxygenase n=1 Tax=Cymbomonas tetramitiformis TaxID=36881 RepID=A0AAE0BXL8_9CHLO|nr:hypothetical protein CYMTET_46369 [Cymbomonas tetramitiformis]